MITIGKALDGVFFIIFMLEIYYFLNCLNHHTSGVNALTDLKKNLSAYKFPEKCAMKIAKDFLLAVLGV